MKKNKIQSVDATISVMSVDNFIKLNISDYTTRETYDRTLLGYYAEWMHANC